MEIVSGIFVGPSKYHQVTSDMIAYDTVLSGGGYYWGHTSQTVLEGGSAIRTEVQVGWQLVSAGGYAESTTLHGYSAGMVVSNLGSAHKTNVLSGGCLYVSAGGKATGINIDSTATMICDVNSNTYITGTSRGKTIKVGDEVTSNITLYYSRYMNVASDWVSYDTVISGSGYYWGDTRQNVQEGGSAIRTDVQIGYLHVSGGGYSDRATVHGNSARMVVSAYGSAHRTTVKDGGTMYMNHLASATNVNIDSTGALVMDVSSDTVLTGTSHGKTVKVGDGVTSNIRLYYSRWQEVDSGWTAYDTVINGDGSEQIVYNGGSAVRTEVNNGYQHVLSGGKAVSTTVNGYARMSISAYGSADSTTVKNGGTMYMNHRASATNVNIDSTGALVMDVSSDTVLTGTSHGKTVKVGDGVTSNIRLYYSRWQEVDSGWTAYDTVINGDGYYWGETKQIVYNGGSAVRTELQIGKMFVLSGGKAYDTTVNGIKADMYISSGAVAENTTLKNSGYVYIAAGAEHTGILKIAKGAGVNVASGGVINFDISDRKSTAGYILNDMSMVSGSPTYTVTVDDRQVSGIYKLAQGAKEFTGTVTIGDGSLDYGTVTVNGDDLVYNGITYSLDNVSGNLTLSVTGGAPAIVDGDIDGNTLADVILVHTQQGYSGAWLTTGTDSVIKWGNLGNVNSKVELVGTGNVYGSNEAGSDIFMKIGTTVAAWVVEDGKVKNYKELYYLKSNMNMLGIADFNYDGVTDYLLRSTTGDLGYVTGDDNKWHYIKGLGKEWKIAAVGDLDGNGTDDVIVRHDAGFTGAYMIDSNGKITWSNLDTLKSDMTIAGTGDFNGDGVDDVLLQNKSNGWVGAWLVENGRVDSFIGLCNNKNTIEQIADFNFDGVDDIRIRTAKGDIGVLYVNGEDDTTWKYFQSVGKEWDTSFALLS